VRVRADLNQLAARGLSLASIQAALAAANSSKPVGSVDQGTRNSILDATGPIMKAADYMPVVVAWQNGAPVRLADVATAVDGVENDKVASWLNGKRAIILALYRQPDANTVEVVDRARALLPALEAELPAGVSINVLNDRSQPIRHAIEDVQFTLFLSMALVIGVIYLFLQSVRATIIPAVALPISIVGTFGGMYLFGHSIDNISLLALTLSVGFVVDDAIVMLENIMRHVENGEKPLPASLVGSREVGFTIVSMTISLVAVFIPVLFMGGVIGRMFTEFGLVISMAILLSGVVSLTLTPMLCARLLRPIEHGKRHNFVLRGFDWGFSAVTRGYAWSLRRTVAVPSLMLLVTLATFVITAMLFRDIPKGFFPTEDNGLVFASTGRPGRRVLRSHGGAPGRARRSRARRSRRRLGDVDGRRRRRRRAAECRAHVHHASGRPERKDGRDRRHRRLRRAAAAVPGINIFLQPVTSINVGTVQSRSQYQYTLQSTDLEALRKFAPLLQERIAQIPGVVDVNSDLQMRARTAYIDINRDVAARLGVTVDQVRDQFYSAFGTRQVSTIYAPEDTYQVILEADEKYADVGEVLRKLALRTPAGNVVPMDSVATLKLLPTALTVNHLAQLPSVTISFNLVPGVALSQAVEGIEAASREIGVPAQIQASFQGRRSSSSRRSPTRASCSSRPCS
jgi:HAE1 family hydrophobic/amphiphilic exporter-1